MKLFAAALSTVKSLAALALQAADVHRPARSPFVRMLLSFGLVGIFPVSIVDSSFVPLPLPGITDIMIIIMAAQHQSVILLVLLATALTSSVLVRSANFRRVGA